MHKKIISIDFDGCLSTYTSGWQGADVIPDPPVENAIQWLESLCRDERFDVQIYSSRNHQDGGIFAMSHWLLDWGFAYYLLDRIGFPMIKPPAHLIIDDRAFCFRGEFPTLDEIANFKPWWKEGKK